MNATTQGLSDEHLVLFLQNLKRELACSSTRNAIMHVRLVLSKLKNLITPEMIVTMPPRFHMMLPANTWVGQRQIHHLDELADSLYRDESKNHNGFLKSEIEALALAIAVLKHIQKLFTRTGLQILPYALAQELKQSMTGETS